MNHVAGTIGCLMLIHGGSNTETRKVLDDFNLFDIELGEWIRCEVSKCESHTCAEEPVPL